MAGQRFSERQGFAPSPEPRRDDYLPQWVREAVTRELKKFTEDHRFSGVGNPDLDMYGRNSPYIWKVLDRQPPTNPVGGPWQFYIPETLLQSNWWQFYDLLEEICELAQGKWGSASPLEAKINALLAKDGIPWVVEGGRVVRKLPPEIEVPIREVCGILTDPKFKGPDKQFSRAVECLNRRPDPDEENCVKDAVGALEGVANIIAGTTGTQLNTLLGREPFRSKVDSTIRQAVEKLYAYRGSAPGAAHGQVGLAEVELPEATWVLAVSAAAIRYLTSKF